MRIRVFVRYKIGFFRLWWSWVILCLSGLDGHIAFQMGMEMQPPFVQARDNATEALQPVHALRLPIIRLVLVISQFTFMMYYGKGAAVAVRGVSNSQKEQISLSYVVLFMVLSIWWWHYVVLWLVFLCLNIWEAGLLTVRKWHTSCGDFNLLPSRLSVWRRLQIITANALRGICIKTNDGWLPCRLFHYFLLQVIIISWVCDGWGVVGVWWRSRFDKRRLMLWWRFYHTWRNSPNLILNQDNKYWYFKLNTNQWFFRLQSWK